MYLKHNSYNLLGHAFGKKVMDAETEKFASHFDDYCCDPYDDGEIKAAPR